MPDKDVIVVWTEIPAADLERAVDFYNATFQWNITIDDSGPNPMADPGGTTEAVGGHLDPGKPGDGPTPPSMPRTARHRLWRRGGRSHRAGERGKRLADFYRSEHPPPGEQGA